MSETYKVPEAARNNARRVLRWREEHGDEVKGMTETGWRRARQLAENESVGIETVRAMSAFNRHRDNADVAEEYKGEPWRDAGHVAWLGWGGTTGIDWARGITGAADKGQPGPGSLHIDGELRIDKRKLEEDVFTEPLQAALRAMQLGLGPAAHSWQTADGPLVWMPGASHEEYLAARGATKEVDSAEEMIEGEDELERAISAIINAVRKREEDRIEAKILKVDEEERLVYGWASVSTINGELVVDKQGDQLEPHVMEKAATRFMMGSRVGKEMHEGGRVGEVIHSFPLTKELGEALGVFSSVEGWLVAMKISDDAVWNRVKRGELRAFSIGGRGKRVAV